MLKKIFFIFFLFISIGRSITITGYVIDNQTDKPIPNANVYLYGTEYGATSNTFGYFKINVEMGIYLFKTSIIGYETDIRNISVKKDDLSFDIKLKSTILEYSEIQVKGLFTSRLGYESIDIIDKEKITSSNNKSIPELLSTIPGIDVQFAHPNGRNVNLSIRGSSDYKPGGYNNRVLLLLDGFPVLIPNSGAPDWNSLPLESIERIEIENSAASTQYGHNSMGGVINLITDNGNNNKNTIFQFSGGSYSKVQSNVIHNNQKGNWYYGINAMAQTSKGHRFNADSQSTRLRTYFRYGDQKGRTYRFSQIISYSDIGHPGFIGFPSYRKSNRLSQYYQIHGFYPLGRGLSMSHSIFLNNFKTLYNHLNDIPENYIDTIKTKYDDMVIGYRSEMLITKFTRWILMIGTDIDWSQSSVSIFNSIYESPTQLSIGGFMQSKYSIGDGWSIGTGIRYDYRLSDPGNNYQKRIYKEWSPKVNLMYTMMAERNFTLSYSKGFRAPSLSELYLEYETSYGLIHKGNPELIPEKVESIEMTYEHPHNETWFWSISIFQNKYKNMIDFVYGIPVLAKNREGITGNGFEFQLRWKPISKFTISSTYAYLDMKDIGSDPILYRSKNRAQLNCKYNYDLITVQIGLHAWSKQLYEDFLDDNHFEFPIRELPGRVITEFSISKEMNDFRTSINCSNIFDVQYELIQDYPMPGFNWQLTLTKNLN